MTPKQTLKAHLDALHKPSSEAKWNDRSPMSHLQRVHSRLHHRYPCSHIHEYDNEGNLVGPGSTDRRPSGWLTGEKVIMRPGLRGRPGR